MKTNTSIVSFLLIGFVPCFTFEGGGVNTYRQWANVSPRYYLKKFGGKL